MFDLILNNFFSILGGKDFLLGVMGVVLTYVIIMALIDNILD